MMTIGEKIKALRTEKNLTQAQFGKELGVTQKAVDYWERNVNDPKASYIVRLVRFAGISFDEFFEDIEH